MRHCSCCCAETTFPNTTPFPRCDMICGAKIRARKGRGEGLLNGVEPVSAGLLSRGCYMDLELFN